jgi:hypothetical protein
LIGERLKALLVRGTETILAVGLVLLFFLAVLIILALSFPEGTRLGGLVLQSERSAATIAGASVEFETSDEDEPFVALLAETRRTVKDKPSRGIAWSDARAGQALEQRHAVQTLDDSGAVISFGGQDRLVLDENSLVVIRKLERRSRKRPRRASVVALEGELSGRLDASEGENMALEVVTAAGSATPAPNGSAPADFKVVVNPDHTSTFSIRSGVAQVTSAGKTVTLRPNETVTVIRDRPPGVPITLPDPPTPLAPENAAVVPFRSAPPELRFAWSETGAADGYVLEISRDPDFEDIAFERRVSGTQFVHGNLRAGHYYWRVAGVAGWAEGEASVSRSLGLVRDGEAPDLRVAFPDGPVLGDRFLLHGITEPGAQIFIGSQQVPTTESGTFEYALVLEPGLNVVVVEAIDVAGNISYRSQLLNAKH